MEDTVTSHTCIRTYVIFAGGEDDRGVGHLVGIWKTLKHG